MGPVTLSSVQPSLGIRFTAIKPSGILGCGVAAAPSQRCGTRSTALTVAPAGSSAASG